MIGFLHPQSKLALHHFPSALLETVVPSCSSTLCHTVLSNMNFFFAVVADFGRWSIWCKPLFLLECADVSRSSGISWSGAVTGAVPPLWRMYCSLLVCSRHSWLIARAFSQSFLQLTVQQSISCFDRHIFAIPEVCSSLRINSTTVSFSL